MRNSWVIGAVLIGVLSRSAVAEEVFKYNYIKIGSEKTTVHAEGFPPKIDNSTYGIFASHAVHELVAIGVQYTKSKISFNGLRSGTPASFNAREKDIFIGATLHKMISDNTELGLDWGRHRTRENSFTSTVASTSILVPGYTDYYNDFGIRVRTALFPDIRLGVSVGRTTGGSSNATTHYGISAEYEIIKNFNLEGGYRLSTSSPGHARGISISGRYYY